VAAAQATAPAGGAAPSCGAANGSNEQSMPPTSFSASSASSSRTQ
jgi:hypothetical protein